MTNKVNQEFEKWFITEYVGLQNNIEDDNCKTWKDFACKGYQARESEIHSLKQRVEELEEANACLVRMNMSLAKDSELLAQKLDAMTDSNNLNHRLASEWADKSTELTADNNKLREAGQALVDRWNTPKWKDAEHTATFIHALEKALSSPPAQSLAEHDNATIDRCKNIVADDALAITFQSMGAYRSAIIKAIDGLKVNND